MGPAGQLITHRILVNQYGGSTCDFDLRYGSSLPDMSICGGPRMGSVQVKVGLGVPYWGDDPLRFLHLQTVSDILGDMFPWDSFAFSYKATERGAARNELVSQAIRLGLDVIVLCDADTYPEGYALRQAIGAAYEHGGLHFPYDNWRLVDGHGDVRAAGPGSLGGCMVIRPDDWMAAGGSPELDGWGFEDVMFAVQARTFLRPNTWYPGLLTCLWHPTECAVGSYQYNLNILECKSVEALDQNQQGLRAHIRGNRLWPHES